MAQLSGIVASLRNLGIIKGVLSFLGKGNLAVNGADSGVHIPYRGRVVEARESAEILYNGNLSIPERFWATTSDSSGALLASCVRF